MHHHRTLITLSLCSALACAQALAQTPKIAVTADYSVPFGLGLAGSLEIMPKTLNARAAIHPSQKFLSQDDVKDGFNVHTEAKFGYVGAFADWFPSGGDFRVSAGLASMSETKINAQGTKVASKSFTSSSNATTASFNYDSKTYTVAIGSQYTYNGVTYTLGNNAGTPQLTGGTAPINLDNTTVNDATANLKADAKIKFRSVAPYLGIGYGNPIESTDGWSFFADLGVFLTGKPKIDVAISNECRAGTDPATCDILRQELQKQSDKTIEEVRDDLNKVKLLPNLSLGVSFAF